VFRHEQFFDEAARDNHARGWAGAFTKLDGYLDRYSTVPSRADVDRDR
jgi:hypothetical protein